MTYYPAAGIINDTAAHTGRFGCIKALQDSVESNNKKENKKKS